MSKEETIDCVRVGLYLDSQRRKATSHEEVKCIDWIFEHFSKRPGRFHDDPETKLANDVDALIPGRASAKLTTANIEAANRPPANRPPANTPSANKPDRKQYMRNLMRQKRANKGVREEAEEGLEKYFAKRESKT